MDLNKHLVAHFFISVCGKQDQRNRLLFKFSISMWENIKSEIWTPMCLYTAHQVCQCPLYWGTKMPESEEKWPRATTNSFISSIINVFLKKEFKLSWKKIWAWSQSQKEIHRHLLLFWPQTSHFTTLNLFLFPPPFFHKVYELNESLKAPWNP